MPLSAPPPGSVDSAQAWVIVAAAFIVGFVVFGILYSFGAFFQSMVAEFGASGTATSALFSITGLIFYFAGPFTGHLGDRFGPRPMIVLGALILATGLALTTAIDQLWVGYLT